MKRWLKGHWWWVHLGVMIPLFVFAAVVGLTETPRLTNRALADALDPFGSASVTCRTQRGGIFADAYNRRCLVIRRNNPWCEAGTGERRTAIFVSVSGDGYHELYRRLVSVTPCDDRGAP